MMTASLPIVLIPGLLCTPRLFAEQLPALWRFGPVMIPDHHQDDSMDAIASRILRHAPERFALAGLSMGGYITFAIVRQAPERVAKLALLDTAARADLPDQAARRVKTMELARSGRFEEVIALLWPVLVHTDRHHDQALKRLVWQMAEETGIEGFIRQQTAIMTRPDSRPQLSEIRCPTTIIVGEGDQITPLKVAEEMAELIPKSKLQVIPDSGHLSTIEKPDVLTKSLVAWMEI